MRVVEVVHVMVPCITAQARLILAILGILVVQYHVGLKSFLDPNTAAIDVVLIFHSLFFFVYYISFHSLSSSSLSSTSSSLSSLDNINSTRPSLDLRSSFGRH